MSTDIIIVIIDNHTNKHEKRHLNILTHLTGMDEDKVSMPANGDSSKNIVKGKFKILSFSQYHANKFYNGDEKYLCLFHGSENQDNDIVQFFSENACYCDNHKLKDNIAICFYSGEPFDYPQNDQLFSKIADANKDSDSIIKIVLSDILADIQQKLCIDAMLNYWGNTQHPSPRIALRHLLGSIQSATRITERLNKLLLNNYHSQGSLKEAIRKIQEQDGNEFKKDMDIISNLEKSKLKTILKKAQSDKEIKIPALSKKINSWLTDNFSRQ